MIFSMRALIFCLLLFALVSPARAQQRQPLDDLVLPQSQQQRLIYNKGKPVWVLLNARPVEGVLLDYLRISRQPDWKLTFPAEAEAITWLEALKKNGGSKVFMLNLYHLKTKVNYVLTIGEVSDTRVLSAHSIITIYSMQRPFGR